METSKVGKRESVALPVEIYTPERKAAFLLSNAVDPEDYRAAVAEVIKMGIDPAKIQPPTLPQQLHLLHQQPRKRRA